MNITKVYKTLTYILSVPTALIGLLSIFGILIALMNPIMLLPIFLLICVVVYVVVSYIFLSKIIVAQQTRKKIIKDLLKINGVIAFFFGAMNLVNFVSMLLHPSLIEKSIADVFSQSASAFPPGYSKEMFIKLAWTVTGLISIYSALLVAHIVLSFRLIKQYAGSFTAE